MKTKIKNEQKLQKFIKENAILHTQSNNKPVRNNSDKPRTDKRI
jgi:hypothetical protein